MQSIARGGYTLAQVTAALQGATGGRDIRFRYDLLDKTNTYIGPLNGMLSCTIQQDASADVKRTATFNLRDGVDSIDYLSNRIKPYIRLGMPDGGWVEWPQGVFLLSSPSRTLATSGAVTRDVAAYDQLVILTSDAVTDRYSIPVGQTFTAAISTLLSGNTFPITMTASSLTLPVTWDYEAGTTKLTILNDLLSAMNYRSAWFDENGWLVCEPYVLPQDRLVGYTYATDATSTIVGDISDDLDLFSVPNKWTLVVSDADQGSFSSTYTNTSASSPTSTVNRGYTILKFDTGQSAADQATLNALTLKKAYEDSQVYESVSFSSALMPMHSNADVLGLSVNKLALGSVKFEELSWSMELKVGGMMSHVVRRTVVVA